MGLAGGVIFIDQERGVGLVFRAIQINSAQVANAVNAGHGYTSMPKNPTSCADPLREPIILSEVKPILAHIYEGFKGEEEESRQQDRIDKAVAKERERWVRRLAGRQRLEIIYFFIFAAFGPDYLARWTYPHSLV